MLKRLSNNFAIWLFVGDMLLTLLALEASRQLRPILPFGLQIDPKTGLQVRFEIDSTFFVIVLLVWVVVFLTLPVYNSKRSLHAIGDAQITLIAIAFAVLILAGIAYLFLSRVLACPVSILHAARRAVAPDVARILRGFQRIRHRAWPMSKRRVLIVAPATSPTNWPIGSKTTPGPV